MWKNPYSEIGEKMVRKFLTTSGQTRPDYIYKNPEILFYFINQSGWQTRADVLLWFACLKLFITT